jgi:CO dehydrogenase nickel-insertion accessory protein CooC1
MKTIAFFNNKGGVGKTSLVYHLAWMYAELGLRVIAADLDPQANLTSMFVKEDRLEELWPDGIHEHTIYGAVQPTSRRRTSSRSQATSVFWSATLHCPLRRTNSTASGRNAWIASRGHSA